MSKILLPEGEKPETLGVHVKPFYEKESSLFEAIINGANAGVKLIVGIVALLIAVLGLVALVVPLVIRFRDQDQSAPRFGGRVVFKGFFRIRFLPVHFSLRNSSLRRRPGFQDYRRAHHCHRGDVLQGFCRRSGAGCISASAFGGDYHVCLMRLRASGVDGHLRRGDLCAGP